MGGASRDVPALSFACHSLYRFTIYLPPLAISQNIPACLGQFLAGLCELCALFAVLIPQGLRPVTPFLHPIGASALIELMKEAFGAEEISREQSPEGMIHHAMVRIGDSMIEMGEAHGDAQPMPPALYMYVENLEETYERALNAGATSLQPPKDQVTAIARPG